MLQLAGAYVDVEVTLPMVVRADFEASAYVHVEVTLPLVGGADVDV